MTERGGNRKKTTACEIWLNNHGVLKGDVKAVEQLFNDPHDVSMVRRVVNRARGNRHIQDELLRRKKRRNWFQG